MAIALGRETAAKTGHATDRLRFRQARALDDVDEWEDAWRKMGRQVGNPFAQFDWQRASLAAFPVDAAPRLIAGYSGETMVALAPLVQQRLHGVCRLRLAGADELGEPLDLAWTDARALWQLIRSVARYGSPLVFARMPADSLSVTLLRKAYRGRAIVVERPSAACPFIALDDRWLAPEQRLIGGFRDDFRDARRAAECLGPVTTEIHAPDLRDLPQLLDTALEVDSGASDDAQRAMFYRQYAQAACVDGMLRICFLRIGDRVAAVQLAVEQGGGFWLIRAGSDARFGHCSPQLLLARETIRYAAEAGATSYEFLSTPTEWSAAWTRDVHRHVSLRVYPLGLRGMAALAADLAVAARRWWREIE